METPLDAYLSEKHGSSQFARNVGGAVAAGVGTAVGAAAVAATGVAASRIVDAVTKARDFKRMLASPFNADLHDTYRSRPREFSAAYSSLRSMNAGFAKDPMVAGTYMRRMMSYDPTSAGGVLIDAVSHRDRIPSPIEEAFLRGGMQGAHTGYAEGLKDTAQRAKEQRSQSYDRELEMFRQQLGQQAAQAQHERSLKARAFDQHLRGAPREGAVDPIHAVQPNYPFAQYFR